MRKLMMMVPLVASLAIAGGAYADGGNCHTETRTRIEYRQVTTYQQRWVVEMVCGYNAWGIYGCAPIGHWVSVPVTVNQPVEVPYTVNVCE